MTRSLDQSSDALCTALQLTNFWQDLDRDWQKGRLYVPLDDVEACHARRRIWTIGGCPRPGAVRWLASETHARVVLMRGATSVMVSTGAFATIAPDVAGWNRILDQLEHARLQRVCFQADAWLQRCDPRSRGAPFCGGSEAAPTEGPRPTNERASDQLLLFVLSCFLPTSGTRLSRSGISVAPWTTRSTNRATPTRLAT